MDQKQLMIFIQHIIENSSYAKTEASLRELSRILQQQLASEEMLQIVQTALHSVPELKEDVKKGYLTEQDLEDAHIRAKARREREEAARSYGRC